jgi:hypothetical protein
VLLLLLLLQHRFRKRSALTKQTGYPAHLMLLLQHYKYQGQC